MARDNYLLEGAKNESFRLAYRAYIQRMLELAGIAGASAKADAIFSLETALAKVQWWPAENSDVARINDPQTIEGLKGEGDGLRLGSNAKDPDSIPRRRC